MASLYDAKGYKEYLVAELGSERFGRGVRSRLAEFLGVQTSFVSLVLAGPQDFSAEHGMRIAEFLGLDADETRYLILLMLRDRTGSVALREHFQTSLREMLKKKSDIKSKVKSEDKPLTPEELSEYYGAWYHTAIHMCLRDPECRDVDRIASALKLDRKLVKSSLVLLERLGFAKRERGKLVPAEPRFHFSDNSPQLRAHHANWRTAAIRALDERRPDGLHYSLVMSIDRKAFSAIRKLLLKTIESVDHEVRSAEDREVCAFSLDFYGLTEPKKDG